MKDWGGFAAIVARHLAGISGKIINKEKLEEAAGLLTSGQKTTLEGKYSY